MGGPGATRVDSRPEPRKPTGDGGGVGPDARLSPRAAETDRMSDDVKDFETALKELESIVDKLERGDLPLEQSLELFERGVRLSRFCHARLEDAERRIEILTERGDRRTAPDTLAAVPEDDGT